MNRCLTMISMLLLVCVAACSLPAPTRPELDPNAPFPNLADVPPRPKTMSPAEREQIRRDLLQNNQDMDAH